MGHDSVARPLNNEGGIPQDAQKGQTSHPPNPGAPRRALSQARPQRAITFKGVAGMIPTARTIPPTQPSARQDALYPERGPSNSLYLPLGEWPRLPSTARIERGPADSPTSPEGVGRLFFTARIERPPFHRGGSASKKNGLPAPSLSSEAARCASTGIVPATPPLFSILPERSW
jgi:hypothetical protein